MGRNSYYTSAILRNFVMVHKIVNNSAPKNSSTRINTDVTDSHGLNLPIGIPMESIGVPSERVNPSYPCHPCAIKNGRVASLITHCSASCKPLQILANGFHANRCIRKKFPLTVGDGDPTLRM